MAYHIDPQDEDAIVFDGHRDGIADDPYEGISDMRNVNIIPIPGEVSVNFATSQISPPAISTGTVTSANSGTEYLTYTGASGLENYMTIVFSATTVGGVSTGTAYWIKNLGGAGEGTFQITSDYLQASTVNISGTGTGTFLVARVSRDPITGGTGIPLAFTYDPVDACYFMLDTVGELWTNQFTTTSGYWTWTGPSGTAQTGQGTGLAYYQAFNGAGNDNRFIFVFRNQTIDYFKPSLGTWVFGWRPSTGAGSYASATLNTSTTFHQAYVGTDNVLYWCDGSYIGSVFEKSDGPPQSISFDPTNTATYTYALQALALPYSDSAQCLAELGVNLMIGGKRNMIYPWNRTATSFTYPILLSEYNIQQMVTVNTNTFIFVGNRGRIYVTNGTNAQFYRKLPDHLSGTVEPYYTWGGATSNKNQLYCSALLLSNTGSALGVMGGVWAIDLDNKSIRLVNQLSYGTYAGYATCLISNFATTPAGTGFYAGWNSSAVSGNGGIDTTTSSPYTGSQAYIDYDLIPVGTFYRPNTPKSVEYKLSVPIVSGESVSIYYRKNFNDAYTLIFTSTNTTNQGGISEAHPADFENAQWVQLRAVLNSTASTPSYTRLTEIRLRGTTL